MLDEISICEVERIKAQIIREMAWDKEEEERELRENTHWCCWCLL